MKVISVWQPYASLLVSGHKVCETRSWPAPASVLGQRIGIASTRIVRQEQAALFEDCCFLAAYRETGLLPLDALPHGYLLGTVEVVECVLIDDIILEDISGVERLFGDWRAGRFAWRCDRPVMFDTPIRVRGQQGLWTLESANISKLPR